MGYYGIYCSMHSNTTGFKKKKTDGLKGTKCITITLNNILNYLLKNYFEFILQF